MLPIIVFVVVALLLFGGAFVSRRRFGLLGLALTAGATLSTIWNYEAGLVVSSLNIVPAGPLTQAVTQSAVVLLPAVVLLFHGQTYKTLVSRLVGAAFFTVLACAFLVEPIGYALPLSGQGAEIYGMLRANRDLIVSIGVILAVLDLFFTKPAHLMEKASRKH